MANKFAVITNAEDAGAWILAFGINEVAKRYPGKIDIDYLEKSKLGDLADNEILYVGGHGSPKEYPGSPRSTRSS